MVVFWGRQRVKTDGRGAAVTLPKQRPDTTSQRPLKGRHCAIQPQQRVTAVAQPTHTDTDRQIDSPTLPPTAHLSMISRPTTLVMVDMGLPGRRNSPRRAAEESISGFGQQLHGALGELVHGVLGELATLRNVDVPMAHDSSAPQRGSVDTLTQRLLHWTGVHPDKVLSAPLVVLWVSLLGFVHLCVCVCVCRCRVCRSCSGTSVTTAAKPTC